MNRGKQKRLITSTIYHHIFEIIEFSPDKSYEILQRTLKVIRYLLDDLSEEWTKSNEGENTWNAFDIMGHFIHGEKTDWMVRVNIILSEGTSRPFEPFDRLAQFRDSDGLTLTEWIDKFEELKERNMTALLALNLDAEKLER